MNELVVIRGLPGSGKSTMAAKFASEGYTHCEADQYFMHRGGYQYDRSKIGNAHAFCLAKAASALEAGHNVVVANTFTRRREIQPYCDAAQRVGAQFRVIVAEGGIGSIHNVPSHTVKNMRKRWEDWP